MCRVTLGHGAVQGGTVPIEWLLCMSFREARVPRSACPVPVQLQACPTNLCVVRQVPTQLHQLSPYTLFSRLHGFYPTFQTSWLNPSVLLRASRWNHFSFRLPSFKGQPRTSYVTSYLAPPMMCYFCQFPHLLPSFCCPL